MGLGRRQLEHHGKQSTIFSFNNIKLYAGIGLARINNINNDELEPHQASRRIGSVKVAFFVADFYA